MMYSRSCSPICIPPNQQGLVGIDFDAQVRLRHMYVAYAKSARAARLPVWRADRSLGPRSSVIDLLKTDVMREVTADGPRTPDIAKTAHEKFPVRQRQPLGNPA